MSTRDFERIEIELQGDRRESLAENIAIIIKALDPDWSIYRAHLLAERIQEQQERLFEP